MLRRLFAIILTISLVSCVKNPEDTTVHVTDVTLNPTSLELNPGDVEVLTATVSPSNATNKTVLWITGNAKVATVDNGVVTAVGEGTTTVTAKSDDGGKTAICTIIVAKKAIIVNNVTLNKSSASLVAGETLTLLATITPADATNKRVSWHSNNTAVATISQSGVVQAMSAGTAIITVTTDDQAKTATCNVTVTEKIIEVSSITLSHSDLTIYEGESFSLTATVNPSNAMDKTVTWTSSNTSVATVSNGKVTALKAGTAAITASCGGKNSTCAVTVQKKTVAVTSVTLNQTSLSLVEGESSTLTATVTPTNATNKAVTWSSSNTSVATVSTSGVVKAKAAGSVTITVKTSDGNKTATCAVTVSAATVPVTSVSLDKTSLSMTVGETQTLTATVYPSNATNKAMSWSSSNSSIASVSSSGVITALSDGTATITVTTDDGAKTAACTAIVYKPSSGDTFTWYAGWSPTSNDMSNAVTMTSSGSAISGTADFYNPNTNCYFYVWVPVSANATVPSTCQVMKINGDDATWITQLIDLRLEGTEGSFKVYRGYMHTEELPIRQYESTLTIKFGDSSTPTDQFRIYYALTNEENDFSLPANAGSYLTSSVVTSNTVDFTVTFTEVGNWVRLWIPADKGDLSNSKKLSQFSNQSLATNGKIVKVGSVTIDSITYYVYNAKPTWNGELVVGMQMPCKIINQ